MSDAVLERDVQDVADLEAAVERGDESAAGPLTVRLLGIARRFSAWQGVIHGETGAYRTNVVRWLCMQGEWKKARRFALCGRGDQGFLEYAGDGVKVVPMGCGCRFCPRCSRRYGSRFLRKVCAHLRSRGHGAIWHVVLTQRVQRSETLEEARERFGVAWKRFYPRLRSLGMEAALATYHVGASEGGGWHYHCHVVVEWKLEVGTVGMSKEVSDAWHWAKRDSGDRVTETFSREVCEAGERFEVEGEMGQGEFWKESVDPVMAALQYVVRDVLQGVEKWVERISSVEDAGSFAEALEGAKLHRLYGSWRHALEKPADEAADEEVTAGAVAANGAKTGKAVKAWDRVGTMDEVLGLAKGAAGSGMEFVRRLHLQYWNRGMVLKRLVRVVRCIA